ncbi:MAG: sigma-70 family RNA polymerase sigma factor [Planctomycetota bacterium]|nr:sigma-70 family RNA polymerase sigma factor [Planctomycetota bacterium]
MAWTDAELVRQTLQGDRDAFGRLVERHRRTVYALALQRGFQPAEAEDVAQEVFIKAFTGLRSLKDPALFERWLYGIGGHVMADAARARKRRGIEQPGLDERSDAAVRAAPPQDRAALRLGEETEEVVRALRSLNEDQRLVVTLRYMHGLSPKQIAERLGEPRGTVRSRLHHALAFLQSAFGGPPRNESARAQAVNGEEGPG